MSSQRRTLALLAVALACAAPGSAQDISGRIVVYGRVEDASSRVPIGGVRILAVDSSAVASTDSLGEFAIALPVAGPHAVYAEQLGYLVQRFDLEAQRPARIMVLRL